MKEAKMLLSTIFLFALCLGGVSAQHTLPAAGGEGSGSGGSASYTLGQLNYTAKTGSTGTVSTGVQQTYEVSVVSGIEEGSGIHLHVAAYPNPARERLTLEIEQLEAESQPLNYQLYDLNGRLLLQHEIVSTLTSVPMEGLMPAIYILRLSAGNQELKTFRILKK